MATKQKISESRTKAARRARKAIRALRNDPGAMAIVAQAVELVAARLPIRRR